MRPSVVGTMTPTTTPQSTEEAPATPRVVCQVFTTVSYDTLKYFTEILVSVIPLCYGGSMSNRTNHRRSADAQRRVIELRRSSAAQPHANRARYSRKAKHKGKGWDV